MTKPHKTSLIILVLLTCVALAILFSYPLYLAIAGTCFVSFFFIDSKAALPKLILSNTKSVYKTMLLMFLISVTLPVLMASGALPTLIYHTSDAMIGQNLLLAAFLIATILSMLLGSAIGTLTILLPLFSSIALQSGIAYPLLIGALISGVYIGDRCSPLSSGLHLLSNITETHYLTNMKWLLASAVIPFILSIMAFSVTGEASAITAQMITSNERLPLVFDLSLWRLLPLTLMILLLVIKQPITRVLTVVFGLSFIMSILNGHALSSLLQMIFSGYRTTDAVLSAFMLTSGFKQMINVILVIFFSGVLNSLLEADQLMDTIIAPFIKGVKKPAHLLMNAGLLSIVLSMVTCSQAMTSMVNGKYLSNHFDRLGLPRHLLVLVTANAGLNVVALIPWNVNGIMIRQLTGVAPLEYLPYSIFVILLTLFSLFVYPFMLKKQS